VTGTLRFAPDRAKTRSARWAATVIVGLALAIGGVTVPNVASAADSNTLYINSTAFGKTGTCTLGDDSYVPGGTNTCTFGAALTKANASATPLTVTLATDFAASIPDGTQAMITPNQTTTNWMNTAHANHSKQLGAYYAALAPMTIDLQNKLGIYANAYPSTSILLAGKNITLRNASEIRNAGSAIVASEGSANLLIENITFTTTRDPYSSTWTCTPTDSSGCVNNSIIIAQGGRISGIEIRNCLFKNLMKSPTLHDPVVFSIDGINRSAVLDRLDFHNNTIINSGSCLTESHPNDSMCTLVYLPSSMPALSATHIRDNTFINDPALGEPSAIAYWGSRSLTTGATPTNIFIHDNYFDGFVMTTIWLAWAGVVSVERNTFGPNTFSNANTVLEETVKVANGTNYGIFINEEPVTNKKIATWRPTAASVAPTGCEVAISAASVPPVSPGTAPTLPLRLDAYWTATNKAEKYLGSQRVASGTSANMTVTLPADAFAPDGSLRGAVRLQTQALEAAQPVSSQFSRVLALDGAGSTSCASQGVTGISPGTGPVQGGGELTLTGTGLQALASSGKLQVVLNGDAVCQPLTVVDDETLTCVVPASTRTDGLTGAVTVTVLAGTDVIAEFPDSYVYLAKGDLQIVKQAWTDVPDGLSDPDLYAVLTTPGYRGATEVPHGTVLHPGRSITWTYTVTYVHLVDGRTLGAEPDVALNQVSVVDDRLGAVCLIPVLHLNTPVGCTFTEVVDV